LLQFDVGGCVGQDTSHYEFFDPSHWLANLTANPAALQYKNYTLGDPEKLFEWTPGARASPKNIAWPPRGKHLQVNFVAPSATSLKDIIVTVHYEIYDSLSALRKWVSVHNEGPAGSAPIIVDSLNYELLRSPNFAPERMSIVKQQANNPGEWAPSAVVDPDPYK
jgi:hypothetical protein